MAATTETLFHTNTGLVILSMLTTQMQSFTYSHCLSQAVHLTFASPRLNDFAFHALTLLTCNLYSNVSFSSQSLHLQLMHAFVRMLLTHRLHMSKQLQYLSVFSVSHIRLSSNLHSASPFLTLPNFVTTHLLLKTHFLTSSTTNLYFHF